MARPLRVILHPGFHKTGTTSVQQTLRANRRVLSAHVRILLRPAMVAVCESARAWSAGGDPLDAALFRHELARLAETWASDDSRPVLLASEDLCGHMPGRQGLDSYAAAQPLMQAAIATITAVHPGAAPVLYFSTRAAGPWLASCHAQHLTASRMVLTAREYGQRYRASADLDAVIDAIAAALPCPVRRAALEDSAARRLGPLEPLLDVIGLPDTVRAALAAQPRANTAPPPQVLDRLLELNRSDLDDAALRQAEQGRDDVSA